MSGYLLEVQDLQIHYPVRPEGVMGQKRVLKAVDGVSFHMEKGDIFGIVGESGCGKTTTGKAIVKLVTPTGGRIFYQGRDIFEHTTKKEELAYRRKLQIIFQDPFSSLDPRFTVGRTIGEPLAIHQAGSKAERTERVYELMDEVGLKREHFTRFPHEFSGGQRQRIGIARALALQPELIVCDEPVSALDVSIQAQILNLMKDLQEKFALTWAILSRQRPAARFFRIPFTRIPAGCCKRFRYRIRRSVLLRPALRGTYPVPSRPRLAVCSIPAANTAQSAAGKNGRSCGKQHPGI